MLLAKLTPDLLAIAKYPYSYSELRQDHPNTGFPLDLNGVDLADFHAVLLEPAQPTVHDVISESAVEGVPVFSGGKWRQTWDTLTLDQATTAINLAAAQERKWAAIKTERDTRKENGVKVGGNWFHSDVFSRTQQIGLAMMGAAVPAVPWKTMDGTFVTMSQTLANQIFQAVAASDMALFAAAETKRAAMMALSNPNTYDASTGWPETHA